MALPRRRLLSLGLVLPALAATGAAAQPAAEATPERPGLFVNLTTDDASAASKAIFFAHRRVLAAGHRPVAIWLNVRAVYLADRRRAPSRVNPSTPDIHQLLRDFMAAGGIVIACQACLGVAGLTEADLIEGVRRGSPDVLMPLLMGPNMRTLSW